MSEAKAQGMLVGKVAVITGAASGIGRSMARRFHAEGAEVVAVDLDAQGLAKVGAELGCQTVTANIAQPEGIAAMLDRPRVDILVNNAGVLDGLTPLHEVDDELWRKVMTVNVDGPFMAMRAVLPAMVEQGGGAILNTCSAAALSGGRAGAAYTASKHALLGLTRSTAWFYGDQGVRCNAIAPGAIQTKMHFRMAPNEAGMEKYSKYFGTMPRQGKAMEVAEVACFLCSDGARYVNGEVVSIDGGWSSF